MKICFVASDVKQGFFKRDFELLEKNFDVTYFCFPVARISGYTTLDLAKTTIRNLIRLFKTIRSCDLCFCWFPDIHSMAAVVYAKILGKHVVTVSGGYGVEVMPEIDYGTLDISHRFIPRFVLKHSDLVLPFSEYALQKTLEMQPHADTEMAPLACDTERFNPEGEKEDIVMTVGFVKWKNLKRKGLENFVQAAKYVPDARFILVGGFSDDSVDHLRSIAPSNVEFTGFLPDDELLKLYKKAKVYCQLSYQEGEGAGGAVGEAMSCGCIPVVSDKAVALRETVGEAGFYAPYGDHETTGDIIQEALDAPVSLGERARERIVDNFSMQQREDRLKDIILDVCEE